jgi:hypothetical protein
MGATWFRRGLQSSVGHTEDQLPRKSNWKRNSRQRRQPLHHLRTNDSAEIDFAVSERKTLTLLLECNLTNPIRCERGTVLPWN